MDTVIIIYIILMVIFLIIFGIGIYQYNRHPKFKFKFYKVEGATDYIQIETFNGNLQKRLEIFNHMYPGYEIGNIIEVGQQQYYIENIKVVLDDNLVRSRRVLKIYVKAIIIENSLSL